MSENSLQFTRVDIKRMPGFQIGFTLDALRPGINVIYGPNASGKTTLVTALNAVLWPKLSPGRAEVTSQFTLGGDLWLVNLFGDSRQCQKDGQPQDPPPLPPVEGCERYTLSLHSLLGAEDASFATAIARETVGGYDITAAANTLKAQESSTRRAVKETTEYANAIKALRDARRKQEDLQTEEDELMDLRQDRQRAREAQQQVELLQQAIRYVEAKRDLRDAEARLSAFPGEMGRLAETDTEQLAEIESNLAQEQTTLRDHKNNISRAWKAMQDCALPEDGIADGLLTSLREKGRTLSQLGEQMRTLKRELEAAKKKMLDAQQRIGKTVDDDHLQQLDVTAFGELASFARQAELLRARLQGVNQTISWLAPSGSADDLEDLRQGRMFLTGWLRMGEARETGDGWLPWVLLATAIVIVVESVTLVTQGLWPFLLGALFGSALAVIGVILLILALRKGESPRQYLREEFGRLNLGQPGGWTEEEVLLNLDELDRRKADADIESERMKRRNDLENEAQKLAEQQKKIDQQRIELIQRFGIVPEAAENVDEAVLYLLAENINRWQAAAQEGRATFGKLSSACRQHEQTLGEINQVLARYNYQPAISAEESMGYIEDMEERNQRFAKAQTELENARQNADDVVARVNRLETDIGQFFESRGIEGDDRITLQQRLDCLADYEASKKDTEAATIQLQHAAAAVKSHPDLMALSKEALEAALVETEGTAASLEQVVERIGGIEARVGMAKASSELGDALARMEEAAQALRSRRELDYEAVTGGVLAAYVKRETVEQTRPAVFRRARDLFARITHGKYELLLDEAATSFRAKDTITRIGHGLDELSSATRIQLLMAVRLAFVEEQEQGIKIPLFFDETLGNSDEERAKAIIQTAMEMARQGRQIFYFTAQLDEVEKWRGITDGVNDLETIFINLAEARQLSVLEQLPLPSRPLQRIEVPKPDGMNYYEYGTALMVPGIDPVTTDIDGVHVWHLFEDSDTLYRVISNNIDSCGQLRGLAELSGISTIGVEETDYERAAASARAIEAAMQYWREGRGKQVDRQALLESGQISATHIDATTALASELGGDGLALIEGLKTRRIARFRSNKRKKLQEHLEENGYIDHRDRLSQEEIILRVRRALSIEIQSGLITSTRVDELVKRVAASGGLKI